MPISQLHPVVPDDLYRLRMLAGCELSRDGQWLALVLSYPDRTANKLHSHLWLVPAQRGKPLQFTFGDHCDSSPRFSPDGQWIAFLSDRSGTSQVHLIRIAGGESRQLSQVAGSVLDFTWSPDGQKLCLTVVIAQTTPDQPAVAPLVHHFTGYSCQPPTPPMELQLLDVKTGRSTPLVRDEYNNNQAVFTPDGQWVVFCSNKHPDQEINFLCGDLWKIRVGGGKKPKLIKTHGGLVCDPAVSPDGRWVAYRGLADPDSFWDHPNLDLYVVPINGGAACRLSGALNRTTQNMVLSDSFDHWGSSPPLWNPDSRSLYSLATDGGQARVYRFALDGSGHEPVVSGTGAVLSFAIDFASEQVLYIESDIHSPGDLYMRPLHGGIAQQRMRPNTWLSRRDLGRLAELRCPAGGGGPVLDGWVLTPPDFSARRKYPGILYIHGGPACAYGPVFMHEFHYLAGLGYVVFFCNPRGSQGYGAAFASATHHDWGNLDYKDLMRFTNYVLKQCPYIDPSRLGVTGGSFGGYMTNWIIGHTQRFKAAVTQRSVNNFLSWIGSHARPFGVASGISKSGLTPWQEQARLIRQSPLAHIERARTPTLVIHSEQDQAAPVEQAQQLYVQLKLLGVETEYVRFPEEGHELSRSGRTDRRIERLKRISGWFDRYLQ